MLIRNCPECMKVGFECFCRHPRIFRVSGLYKPGEVVPFAFCQQFIIHAFEQFTGLLYLVQMEKRTIVSTCMIEKKRKRNRQMRIVLYHDLIEKRIDLFQPCLRVFNGCSLWRMVRAFNYPCLCVLNSFPPRTEALAEKLRSLGIDPDQLI